MRYRVVVTIEQEPPDSWDPSPPTIFRKGTGPWGDLETALKTYHNTGYPWAYNDIEETTQCE